MPKQSFLSTDFFVATSEENAFKALSLLPARNGHILLVKENNILHTTRFSFEHAEKSFQTYIDVSVLPLDDQYVRFSLHGYYTNGRRIEDNAEIELALACFEKLVYEALNIDYPVKNIKQRATSYSLKTFLRLPVFLFATLFIKQA